MEKKLQETYDDVFFMYQRLVSTMKWTNAQLSKHAGDPEYCVDVGFVMKELDKLLHDIGLEIRKTCEIAEMLACRAWLQSNDDQPIRTEHCTASPRLKMQPALPPKDSPEMDRLLDWLGVTMNHDAVRIHWPTFCDIVTKAVEHSKPIPDCVDPANLHNPEMKLTFLKRKGVTE